MKELTRLIGDLRALYEKISVLRLRSRMESRTPGRPSAEDVDIAGPLKTYIETTAADGGESGAFLDTDSGSDGLVEQESDAGFLGTGRRLFGDLSNWWRLGGRGSRIMEPHMAEKLQKSATEHINRALLLGKQGKVGAAKVHADLAESAVKAAAQYMGEAEYQAFKAQVRERLAQLCGYIA